MYIYALNGESYWTPCACLAVHHFIHTNPYNFANIPSPSKTHEMLVFSKIQPNWARPSVLPNSHCFDNLDRARLMWSPGGGGGGGGGGRCEVRRFHQRLNILFCKAINGFRIECVLHRNFSFFGDRDPLLYMYSTFQVSHINSFNFYYCVLAF